MTLRQKFLRFILAFVIIAFVANIPIIGYLPYIHHENCEGKNILTNCGGTQVTALLNPVFWLPAVTLQNTIESFEGENYYNRDNPFAIRLFRTYMPTEQYFTPMQNYYDFSCIIFGILHLSDFCDPFPQGSTGGILFQLQLAYWLFLAILLYYLSPTFQTLLHKRKTRL